VKTVRVPRPEDPELAAAWDEAKRIVEARDVCSRCLGRQGMHYSWCTASADPDCCVGDRSQCRCAAKQLAVTDEDVEREKWMAVWRDEVEP